MGARRGVVFSAVSFSILLLAVSAGCSQSTQAPSSEASYPQEMASVNDALNASEQYALTRSDVAALNSEGLLDSDDVAALNTLVKK